MRYLMLLLIIPSVCLGCDKGYIEFNGSCAADLKPEISQGYEIQPSGERPPRSGRPSYEAEGVHADMPSIAKENSVPASDDIGKQVPNSGVPKRQ